MPKVKVRPSPSQSRVLQMLSENRGLFLSWVGSGSGHWNGIGFKKAFKALGNPTARTMRILIDEGWIELEDGRSRYYQLSEAGGEALDQKAKIQYTGSELIMSEQDVVRALRKKYGRDWILSEQVRLKGYQDSIVDVLAIRNGGKAQVRIFEIKVSRSDFLAELKNHRKRLNAMELANEFLFAAPVGMIDPKELPEGCGLVEIHRGGKAYVTIEGSFTMSDHPSWRLVVEIVKGM